VDDGDDDDDGKVPMAPELLLSNGSSLGCYATGTRNDNKKNIGKILMLSSVDEFATTVCYTAVSYSPIKQLHQRIIFFKTKLWIYSGLPDPRTG
jgi:hypothetical protein